MQSPQKSALSLDETLETFQKGGGDASNSTGKLVIIQKKSVLTDRPFVISYKKTALRVNMTFLNRQKIRDERMR